MGGMEEQRGAWGGGSDQEGLLVRLYTDMCPRTLCLPVPKDGGCNIVHRVNYNKLQVVHENILSRTGEGTNINHAQWLERFSNMAFMVPLTELPSLCTANADTVPRASNKLKTRWHSTRPRQATVSCSDKDREQGQRRVTMHKLFGNHLATHSCTTGLTELCKQVHHSLHTATSSQCLHQNRAQCLQPTIPHHAYYLNATCYRQFGCCNHTSFSSSCAARQSAILLAVIEALVSRTTTELPACSTAARMQFKHSWTIEWA